MEEARGAAGAALGWDAGGCAGEGGAAEREEGRAGRCGRTASLWSRAAAEASVKCEEGMWPRYPVVIHSK